MELTITMKNYLQKAVPDPFLGIYFQLIMTWKLKRENENWTDGLIPRLGTYLKEYPEALKQRTEGKEQERGSGTEECRAERRL